MSIVNQLVPRENAAKELNASVLEVQRAWAQRLFDAVVTKPANLERPTRLPEFSINPSEFQKLAGSLDSIRIAPGTLNSDKRWYQSERNSQSLLLNDLAKWITEGGVEDSRWNEAFGSKFKSSKFHSPKSIKEVTVDFGNRIPTAIRNIVDGPYHRGFGSRRKSEAERAETVGDRFFEFLGYRAMRVAIEKRFGATSRIPKIHLLFLTPGVHKTLLSEGLSLLSDEPIRSRAVPMEVQYDGRTFQVMGRVAFNFRALYPGAGFVRRFEGLF